MSILSSKKNCHFLFTSLDKLKFPETKKKPKNIINEINQIKTLQTDLKENSLLKSLNTKTVIDLFRTKKNILGESKTLILLKSKEFSKSKNRIKAKNISKNKRKKNSEKKYIKKQIESKNIQKK